ncbi:HAD-IC family P-type ATPase [Clostridium ganghwense]|uniref:Cd(2+)-exporting ATPase n=1 Tax=Clostridium ganghwense TaxID=312089 RepID=A0ABT4CQI5_9CLOT|nr:HAD-IC family P-type ATPase [Clostridium ganghwense]MCY6370259.1 HAD-IC family P-type ATPase [Clostridium ganghwense]
MKAVSILPGRIRFRSSEIIYNKSLAKYINIYTDNLCGVKKSKIDSNTGSILVIFDETKLKSDILKENIENALTSSCQNKIQDLHNYHIYFKTIDLRNRAKKRFLFWSSTYIIFKIKQAMFGKFSISRNINALKAASAVTIIAGYPLLKKFYGKFTKKVPADCDILLNLTAISFTLLRESTKGIGVLVLKSLTDYIKLSADLQCMRLLNQNMAQNVNMAWLYNENNGEILVPISSINTNDIVIVHKGEVIPVEGEIIDGSATINSLYYTGQPVVNTLKIHNKVYEGFNLISGEIKIKVTKKPKELSKKTFPIEHLKISKNVERYHRLSSPLSLAAAGLTYLVTGNILYSLSTILVLCPSAASTALSIGMKNYFSLLSKYNIYLKNPNVLENVIKADSIVFDKTGTITKGKMEIKAIDILDNNYSTKDLLEICSACESNSYHPISITFREEISNEYDLHKLQSSVLIPSKGISASYNNQDILIGNIDLMQENNINLAPAIEKYNNYKKQCLTPILVSIDNKIISIIAMEDTLKETSYELIKNLNLKELNDISLLTGDTYERSIHIAKKLNIKNIYSECTNEDKFSIISQKKKYNTVIMVGEGINDLDAMKAADVSISFANSACDKTKIHSDCLIFNDNMNTLFDFISLSEKSYKKINQSINYVKLYNYVLGILSILGCIGPFAGKSLHTISSLSVLILNERIKYIHPKKIYSPPTIDFKNNLYKK